MPNCFQLTRKGEKAPTKLNKLDEEIAALLGEKVHETAYCWGWMDSIGFLLSLGKTWDEIRAHRRECAKEWAEKCKDIEEKAMNTVYLETTLRIVDYLEANFTSASWHQ